MSVIVNMQNQNDKKSSETRRGSGQGLHKTAPAPEVATTISAQNRKTEGSLKRKAAEEKEAEQRNVVARSGSANPARPTTPSRVDSKATTVPMNQRSSRSGSAGTRARPTTSEEDESEPRLSSAKQPRKSLSKEEQDAHAAFLAEPIQKKRASLGGGDAALGLPVPDAGKYQNMEIVRLSAPSGRAFQLHQFREAIRNLKTGSKIAYYTGIAMKCWQIILLDKAANTSYNDGSYDEAKTVPGLIKIMKTFYHPEKVSKGNVPAGCNMQENAMEEAMAFAAVFDLGDDDDSAPTTSASTSSAAAVSGKKADTGTGRASLSGVIPTTGAGPATPAVSAKKADIATGRASLSGSGTSTTLTSTTAKKTAKPKPLVETSAAKASKSNKKASASGTNIASIEGGPIDSITTSVAATSSVPATPGPVQAAAAPVGAPRTEEFTRRFATIRVAKSNHTVNKAFADSAILVQVFAIKKADRSEMLDCVAVMHMSAAQLMHPEQFPDIDATEPDPFPLSQEAKDLIEQYLQEHTLPVAKQQPEPGDYFLYEYVEGTEPDLDEAVAFVDVFHFMA